MFKELIGNLEFHIKFDLSLLALLIGTKGNLSSDLMTALLMLNPTDVFRLINYQIIETGELSGVLTVMQDSSIGVTGLFLVLISPPLMAFRILPFFKICSSVVLKLNSWATVKLRKLKLNISIKNTIMNLFFI